MALEPRAPSCIAYMHVGEFVVLNTHQSVFILLHTFFAEMSWRASARVW